MRYMLFSCSAHVPVCQLESVKSANTRVKEKQKQKKMYPNKMRTLHIMLWLWQDRNTTVECVFAKMWDKLFNFIPSVYVCLGIRSWACVFRFLSGNDVGMRVRESQANRLRDFMCRMETAQEYAIKSKFARVFTLSLPHIAAPVNVVTMCGNLFDPYHAQKQMSWNATDTVCE